jgi:hypothetical protein
MQQCCSTEHAATSIISMHATKLLQQHHMSTCMAAMGYNCSVPQKSTGLMQAGTRMLTLCAGLLLDRVSRLLHMHQQTMLVRQACHKRHRKHISDSPADAAAAAVGRDRSQFGAVKSTCKDTQAGRCSAKRSNKEACSVKTQGHAAHMSTHNGVAGLPGTVEVFKHAS